MELPVGSSLPMKLSEVGSLYNRGVRHIDQGQDDLAIADFSEAIRLNPNFVSAFVRRGLAYTLIGEYDHAIADYGAAITLDPQTAEYFSIRGDVHQNKIELDRAIEDTRGDPARSKFQSSDRRPCSDYCIEEGT